jgi:predicted RNase H-like HicB family nuclease
MTKSKETTVKYHAKFELDPSGHWLVELEEIPQVHSFGRTLGKAREYLLDALALWLGEPVDKLACQVVFRSPTLPSHVQETVDMAIAERQIAEAATRVAADLTAKASAGLVQDAHLSMRDAADILGLSHQRVQQLLAVGQTPTQRTPDPIADMIDGLSKSLREYLPGGSKEDLGALAAAVAIALGVVWIQSK